MKMVCSNVPGGLRAPLFFINTSLCLKFHSISALPVSPAIKPYFPLLHLALFDDTRFNFDGSKRYFAASEKLCSLFILRDAVCSLKFLFDVKCSDSLISLSLWD